MRYDLNIFPNGGTPVRSFGGNQALCADGDGSVFPLDLENEELLSFLENTFKTSVTDYDCHYFKLDFLVRSQGFKTTGSVGAYFVWTVHWYTS